MRRDVLAEVWGDVQAPRQPKEPPKGYWRISALSRRREEHELSLDDLAAGTGIPRVDLWKIEKGSKWATDEQVCLIAAALDVELADLCGN